MSENRLTQFKSLAPERIQEALAEGVNNYNISGDVFDNGMLRGFNELVKRVGLSLYDDNDYTEIYGDLYKLNMPVGGIIQMVSFAFPSAWQNDISTGEYADNALINPNKRYKPDIKAWYTDNEYSVNSTMTVYEDAFRAASDTVQTMAAFLDGHIRQLHLDQKIKRDVLAKECIGRLLVNDDVPGNEIRHQVITGISEIIDKETAGTVNQRLVKTILDFNTDAGAYTIMGKPCNYAKNEQLNLFITTEAYAGLLRYDGEIFKDTMTAIKNLKIKTVTGFGANSSSVAPTFDAYGKQTADMSAATFTEGRPDTFALLYTDKTFMFSTNSASTKVQEGYLDDTMTYYVKSRHSFVAPPFYPFCEFKFDSTAPVGLVAPVTQKATISKTTK